MSHFSATNKPAPALTRCRVTARRAAVVHRRPAWAVIPSRTGLARRLSRSVLVRAARAAGAGSSGALRVFARGAAGEGRNSARAVGASRARVVGRGTGRTIVPLKEERLA